MRAASLDILLDFETNWDKALADVIGQLGLPVRTAGSTQKLEPPHFEVVFTYLGEAPATPNSTQPHQLADTGSGRTFWPTSFKGRAQIELHVHRGKLLPEFLTSLRGGMRRMFMPNTAFPAFNGVVLPYYDLLAIGIPEGERLVSEDRDLDVTILRYDLVFAIREDAWP